MPPLAPLCNCTVCTSDAPEMYVTSLASVEALRARTERRSPDWRYCPRCGGRLGITEVVVDSVGYAHFVQPCAACAALWVL